jgi:hypothetical protein
MKLLLYDVLSAFEDPIESCSIESKRDNARSSNPVEINTRPNISKGNACGPESNRPFPGCLETLIMWRDLFWSNELKEYL